MLLILPEHSEIKKQRRAHARWKDPDALFDLTANASIRNAEQEHVRLLSPPLRG